MATLPRSHAGKWQKYIDQFPGWRNRSMYFDSTLYHIQTKKAGATVHAVHTLDTADQFSVMLFSVIGNCIPISFSLPIFAACKYPKGRLIVHKFCTYEEFEKGSAVLREFCMLRAESVKGQLNGTIGKTSDTQKSDTLVDGSKLNTSAMGSMGGMGGKGGMDFPGMGGSSDKAPSGTDNKKPSGSDSTSNFPQRPSGQSRPTTGNSNNTDGEESSTNSSDRGQMQFPGGMSSDRMPSRGQTSISPSSLVMVFVSIIALGFGLVFVSKYKRRR